MSFAPLIEPKNKLIIGSIDGRTWTEGFSRETGIKPGHILSAYKSDGTDDFGVVRSNGILPVLGFAGYEDSFLVNPSAPADYGSARPELVTDPFGENAVIQIDQGANTFPMMWLTRGSYAKQGCVLFSWGNGEVVPGFYGKNGITVMVPFSKKTTEFDTAFLIPKGIRITGAGLYVETAVSAATIDVGVLSSLSGGDADGFLKGASLADAGFVDPVTDASATSGFTAGAYIVGTAIKSADATAIYFTNVKPYTIPNGTMRLSYTTTDHTVSGYILLSVEGMGIVPVARCQKTTDATVEVTRVAVLSLL